MRTKGYLFWVLFLGLAIVSCGDDELSSEAQLEKDIMKIEDYLLENNLMAESTASGLHYIIQVEGTGANPTINDKVKVNYKGYFLDGTVFDQNGPIEFPLANVILGWQEGIQLFKKGGKGVLLLPSGLAYGKNPPPGIPANAVLAFDVELLDF